MLVGTLATFAVWLFGKVAELKQWQCRYQANTIKTRSSLSTFSLVVRCFVNHRINLQLGRDRWILLTGGPNLGLAGLTMITMGSLIYAVQHGLLGYPDMMVAGNGLSAYNLNWYQDIAAESPQTAWVISVPILAYRLPMLAWALWLAFALLHWLKWGWGCCSLNGLWRKRPKIIKSKNLPAADDTTQA